MILQKKRDLRFITVRRGGTLQDSDHHLLSVWAANCAQHVLHLFEEIKPNGITREDTWLCDLGSHSCMNPAQKKTIEKNYVPIVDEFELPLPTVPAVPRKLTVAIR